MILNVKSAFRRIHSSRVKGKIIEYKIRRQILKK